MEAKDTKHKQYVFPLQCLNSNTCINSLQCEPIETVCCTLLLLLEETQSSGRLIEMRCQTVLTVLQPPSTSGWGQSASQLLSFAQTTQQSSDVAHAFLCEGTGSCFWSETNVWFLVKHKLATLLNGAVQHLFPANTHVLVETRVNGGSFYVTNKHCININSNKSLNTTTFCRIQQTVQRVVLLHSGKFSSEGQGQCTFSF